MRQNIMDERGNNPKQNIRDEKSNHKKLLNVVPPEPGILLLAMQPFTEEVDSFSQGNNL